LEYADKSLLELSVQESEWNLAIIESLSPSKHEHRNKSISIESDKSPLLKLKSSSMLQ
jgi:hypothetical protein